MPNKAAWSYQPLDPSFVAKVERMRVKPGDYVPTRAQRPSFDPDHGTHESIRAAVRAVVRRRKLAEARASKLNSVN